MRGTWSDLEAHQHWNTLTSFSFEWSNVTRQEISVYFTTETVMSESEIELRCHWLKTEDFSRSWLVSFANQDRGFDGLKTWHERQTPSFELRAVSLHWHKLTSWTVAVRRNRQTVFRCLSCVSLTCGTSASQESRVEKSAWDGSRVKNATLTTQMTAAAAAGSETKRDQYKTQLRA